jgi:hypothetical protein
MDTDIFSDPFIQPLHNEGWEDGLYISRDGKHMYAFYMPADLIRYLDHLSQNPVCPTIHPYLRGPLLGIDTLTNPFGCASILHSDIIYATRNDTSLPFDAWTSSNLANPVEFEGAPQTVARADGSLEFLVYTQSDSGQTDIYWLQDPAHNPLGPGTLMPHPVNTPTTYEDNPHLERINDSTLVLLLDDHSDPAQDADIFYSISRDDGATWSPKAALTSVNTSEEDIQPHLWFDGTAWWLYYVTPDMNDPFNRLAIFRMKQSTANDWDSWSNRELVISAGSVSDGSGACIAVGEPSLTEWGDLSFVLVLQALGTNDSTNQFEIDPWYVARKSPLNTIGNEEVRFQPHINVFPNPAGRSIQVASSQEGFLKVYDVFGRLEILPIEISSGVTELQLNLRAQVYFFHIETLDGTFIRKVVVENPGRQ